MAEFRRRLESFERRLDTVGDQQIEQLEDLSELRGDMKATKTEIAFLRIDIGVLTASNTKLTDSLVRVTDTFNRWKGGLVIILAAAPILGPLLNMFIRVLIFGAPPSK